MDTNEQSQLSGADLLFLVGLSVAAILIPGFILKIQCLGGGSTDQSPLQLVAGILVGLIAVLLVGLNLYASFIRPWLHQRAHGDLDDYRYVSGIPLVGSLLLGLAALFLPASLWIGVLLLILYFADPGGILLAAIVILRECISGKSNNA